MEVCGEFWEGECPSRFYPLGVRQHRLRSSHPSQQDRGPSYGAVEVLVSQDVGGGLTIAYLPLAKARHWRTDVGLDSIHTSNNGRLANAI